MTPEEDVAAHLKLLGIFIVLCTMGFMLDRVCSGCSPRQPGIDDPEERARRRTERLSHLRTHLRQLERENNPDWVRAEIARLEHED